MPLAPRIMLIIIMLVAFAVRAHHLAFDSLWSDEGISLLRAAEPLRTMLAAMPVEHTPGYFVALQAWIALVGASDYAVRFLSLIGSVLAVALLQRLGSDLARPSAVRRWIGMMGAALLATNATQVAYAQEARMYAWLVAMSLLATVALWNLLNPPRVSWRYGSIAWGAIYAFAVAACVYLHYFGALVPITQALYVLGWVLVTRRWRLALRWVGWSAVALLLFAPWLPRTLGIFGFDGWRTGGSVAEIPMRYLVAYTGATSMPSPWSNIIPWMMLALALTGLIWWTRFRPAGGLLVGAMTIAPFVAVLLLAARNPDYHERYTLFLAAPLMALAAAGTIALEPRLWSRDPARRRLNGLPVATATVAAILVGANFAALAGYYGDYEFRKPDYRAAAMRIQSEQHPGDVILVDGPNPDIVFNHYYSGGLPVIDLRDLEGASADEVDARLRAATAGAGRVWELLYFHEPGGVQEWLATHAWATEPTLHNDIRVTLYGVDDEAQPEASTAPNLDFGDALTLEKVIVAPTPVNRGDVLRVTTDWQTHAAPADLKFSLRLTDQYGALAQASDYRPQNWFAPTSAWAVNQAARDQHGLLTEPLGTGIYTVTLRLYDEATGAAIATSDGEDIPLGVVELLP